MKSVLDFHKIGEGALPGLTNPPAAFHDEIHLDLNRRKNMMENKKKHLLEAIDKRGLKLPVAIGLLALFGYYYFLGVKWSNTGVMGNVPIYLVSVALFFAVAGISALVLAAIDLRKPIQISERTGKLAAALLIPVTVVFLLFCYRNEIDFFAAADNYLRHEMPEWMYFLLLLPCVVLVYRTIRRVSGSSKQWRFLLAGFVAFVQALLLWAPNPILGDPGLILFHVDAYTNSIFNTLACAPFELYSSSIYGHHGLFYFVPVKLLHKFGMSYWMALTVVICVLAFVTFLCEYWCIHRMVKNDVVFALAVFATAMISFQMFRNVYYQMLPHRLLFQALMMTGCVIAYQRPKSVPIRVILWIVAGLSMLWNIETGLIIVAVWTLACIYLDAMNQKKYTLGVFVKNACFALIAAVMGYALINGYNLLVGGNPISVSTYIYPIGSPNYRIETLQLPLMSPAKGYFMIIALMLGVMGLYFLDGIHIRLDEKGYIAFLAAAMGLGLFTYYMNRAVNTNAVISAFSMILLLAFACDRFLACAEEASDTPLGWKGLWDSLRIRTVIGMSCVVILTGMSLGTVASLGASFKDKPSTTWETKSLSNFIWEAEEKIPRDSVAFGKYTAQLFGLMHRYTGIYIADWPDTYNYWLDEPINPDALAKLAEILEENQFEHIVVNADEAGYLPEGRYQKMESFQYDQAVFELYERIKNDN